MPQHQTRCYRKLSATEDLLVGASTNGNPTLRVFIGATQKRDTIDSNKLNSRPVPDDSHKQERARIRIQSLSTYAIQGARFCVSLSQKRTSMDREVF